MLAAKGPSATLPTPRSAGARVSSSEGKQVAGFGVPGARGGQVSSRGPPSSTAAASVAAAAAVAVVGLSTTRSPQNLGTGCGRHNSSEHGGVALSGKITDVFARE